MASQAESSTPNELDLDPTALIPAGDPFKDFPPEPRNFGETPTFGRLTLLFEALQAERKQDKRRETLQKWFSKWRQLVGPNFYPILRLILPQKDRERSVYHCKEANIAKALIAVMGIEKTPDASRLLNWKRPSTHQKSAAGDFPGLVYEVLSKRSSITEGGTLRIDQLNDLLDELSKRGSILDHQKRIFSQFFAKCAASEIRWIIKIILKDLNVGVKETTVLSVFHPDALAIFNSSSDLKRVAYELCDPTHHVNEMEKTVRMFRSFAPMLSKRPPKNLADAVKRFNGVPFLVEEKLDGERIQLHKRGNRYFYCSRKSKDYTYLYGKGPEDGSLTPFLHASFNPEVHECILDGEMLVWDPISERYLPFGTLKSHAGAPSREYSPRPCFKVFDLLYLNGQSLTHESLAFRRRNLQNVFDPVDGRFEIVQQHSATTLADVQKLLRETVEARGEGLILKHPLSTYLLNGRNDYWIKIKPEYMEGDGETFDLLVVGGNYGSGSRGGGVSTLICAVRDDRPSAAKSDRKWCSFCRIGSGLSFADFMMIRAKPWIDWGAKGPSFLETAPRSRDDKGDVYLNPEDSFVVAVKAAEITESDQYHLRLTLRFPRAVRIREEFQAEDAASASEIFEHIASGKKRKQEEAAGPNKKRRVGGRKQVQVAGAFQSAGEANKVPATSKLFAGKTFVVYSTTQAAVPYNKPEIENIIRANGGGIRSRRSANVEEILIYGGEKEPIDIKKIIKENTRNLLYPQWVLDCVRKQKLVPLREKYRRFTAIHHDPVTEDEDNEASEEVHLSNAKISGQEGTSEQPEGDAGLSNNPAEYTRDELEARPHSDWIKLEPEDSFDLGGPVRDLSDEEITDHEDLDDDHEEGIISGEGWVDLFESTNASSDRQRETASSLKETRMGEAEGATEYDTENLFKHLCFYLDSPSCARKNGMRVSSRNERVIEARFVEVTQKILSLGGRVTTQISEPKLTHVVLDQDDLSRRVELMRLTELPRRRRFVIGEYITDSVEERTLLNEDDYLP